MLTADEEVEDIGQNFVYGNAVVPNWNGSQQS